MVGAHFWNVQDELMAEHWSGVTGVGEGGSIPFPGEMDGKVLLKVGSVESGGRSVMPRVLVVDVRSGLGEMRAGGALVGRKGKGDDVVDTWSGKVERFEARGGGRRGVVRRMLDGEEEEAERAFRMLEEEGGSGGGGGGEGDRGGREVDYWGLPVGRDGEEGEGWVESMMEVMGGGGRKKWGVGYGDSSTTSDSSQLLDDEIGVWCDYFKPLLHRTSLHGVGSGLGGLFHLGLEGVSGRGLWDPVERDRVEEMWDGGRVMLEESDHVQGGVFVIDGHSGMGGVGCGYLERMREEMGGMGKGGILACVCVEPGTMSDGIRLTNLALTIAHLSSSAPSSSSATSPSILPLSLEPWAALRALAVEATVNANIAQQKYNTVLHSSPSSPALPHLKSEAERLKGIAISRVTSAREFLRPLSIDPLSPFPTTSILATALDTITSPTRRNNDCPEQFEKGDEGGRRTVTDDVSSSSTSSTATSSSTPPSSLPRLTPLPSILSSLTSTSSSPLLSLHLTFPFPFPDAPIGSLSERFSTLPPPQSWPVGLSTPLSLLSQRLPSKYTWDYSGMGVGSGRGDDWGAGRGEKWGEMLVSRGLMGFMRHPRRSAPPSLTNLFQTVLSKSSAITPLHSSFATPIPFPLTTPRRPFLPPASRAQLKGVLTRTGSLPHSERAAAMKWASLVRPPLAPRSSSPSSPSASSSLPLLPVFPTRGLVGTMGARVHPWLRGVRTTQIAGLCGESVDSKGVEEEGSEGRGRGREGRGVGLPEHAASIARLVSHPDNAQGPLLLAEALDSRLAKAQRWRFVASSAGVAGDGGTMEEADFEEAKESLLQLAHKTKMSAAASSYDSSA